jgi:PAS domain S-box-containing protein
MATRIPLRLNSLLLRLLIGLGIPLLLFVAVSVVAIMMNARLVTALQRVKHSQEVIAWGIKLENLVEGMHLEIHRSVIAGDGQLSPAFEQRVGDFFKDSQTLKDLVSDNSVQQGRLSEVRRRLLEWTRLVQKELSALEWRMGQSRAEFETQARKFFGDIQADRETLDRVLAEFVALEQQLLADRQQKAERESSIGQLWILGMSLLTALITILVAVVVVRDVTEPIKDLEKGAAEFQKGTLRVIPVRGPTEVAHLISNYNQMAVALLDRARLLQVQEERYRTYVGAVSQLLWLTNARGEVFDDLPSWRAYTGQNPDQVRGLGFLDAVHPEDRAELERGWLEAITQQNLFESEVRLRRADGAYRDFHCRAVPVMGADGNLREWIGTCADVSDRNEAQRLKRDRDEAEAASRAKSDFLARMSHELRTPLNAVIGMSKLLATKRFGPLNEKQAEYIADISQAGDHLLSLINGILDLAKVEAGKMDLELEPVPLNDAIEGVVAGMRVVAESKSQALSTTLSAPGLVTTDLVRFRQILYNLLANAVKFTPAKGHIDVIAEWIAEPDAHAPIVDSAEASAFRIHVRDTGLGIPPCDRDKIWEEFHQRRGSIYKSHEGTGLGLAVTRRLVKLLGGDVWFESVPNEGSTFSFLLPRTPATTSKVGNELDEVRI